MIHSGRQHLAFDAGSRHHCGGSCGSITTIPPFGFGMTEVPQQPDLSALEGLFSYGPILLQK